MKDQYAVIGNPIAHSKSPIIHKAFAEQTRQILEYRAILAPLDQFEKTARNFQQQGGKGFNVTVPFKQQAWRLAQQHSARAQEAQVVNTIICQPNGDWYGDNTDGIGLIRDFTQNQRYSLVNKKILILGAGGAVQGILPALIIEHPKQIILTNRTIEKAIALAEMYQLAYCTLKELSHQIFDLIIHATSAELQQRLPDLPENLPMTETFCYDLSYASQLTPFLQWAKAHGAQQYCDGLGMLVEQAAEAFYLWRAVRPKTAPVLALLRKHD